MKSNGSCVLWLIATLEHGRVSVRIGPCQLYRVVRRQVSDLQVEVGRSNLCDLPPYHILDPY